MGVAILHPLTNKPLISDAPKMNVPNSKPKPPRTSRTRNKKQTHSSPQNLPRPHQKPKVTTNNPAMGQVKILKRGEQLIPETTPNRHPKTETVEKALSSTLTLSEKVDGPLPYAGYSLTVLSPPPSSVPLPVFITKKIAAVRDATSGILRLNFSEPHMV